MEKNIELESDLDFCTEQQNDADFDIDFCPECQKEVTRSSKAWTLDRYRIPYKKVCYDCFDKVQEEIDDYIFHPDDAGECLDG